MIAGMHWIAETFTKPAEVPVPVAPEWSGALVVVLVWVAAAVLVLGPLARYWRMEPRNEQAFSDDKPAAR